jgi:hypothetical protein
MSKKYSPSQIQEIDDMFKSGLSYSEVLKKFNISSATLTKFIKSGLFVNKTHREYRRKSPATKDITKDIDTKYPSTKDISSLESKIDSSTKDMISLLDNEELANTLVNTLIQFNGYSIEDLELAKLNELQKQILLYVSKYPDDKRGVLIKDKYVKEKAQEEIASDVYRRKYCEVAKDAAKSIGSGDKIKFRQIEKIGREDCMFEIMFTDKWNYDRLIKIKTPIDCLVNSDGFDSKWKAAISRPGSFIKVVKDNLMEESTYTEVFTKDYLFMDGYPEIEY